MTNDSANDRSRRKKYPGFLWRLPVLTGLLSALLVYAVALFTSNAQREQYARQEALRGLGAVAAALDETWERSARLSGVLARWMNGADSARMQSFLEPCRILYPGLVLCAYDRLGNPLSSVQPERGPDTAPVPHTVRNMLQKALFGRSATGFTSIRGFLAISMVVPVQSGEAGALMLGFPLDTLTLKEIREISRADIAVFPFRDLNDKELLSLSEAASTFSLSGDETAEVNALLASYDNGAIRSDPAFFSFGRRGVQAVLSPLAGPEGGIAGVLMVAPLEAPPAIFSLWPPAAALAAGAVCFAFTAWLMRRRREGLFNLFANALDGFAEDARAGRSGSWREAGWPAPLAESFGRLSVLFRECGPDGRSSRASGRDGGADEQDKCGNEHFLRLFDNAPSGVFQTDAEGQFIRVNQAFVLMLGYTSQEELLMHRPGFANFFLYADGMINPLSAMAEQRGVRHIVALRRRDGGVRLFTLLLSFVTAPNGEFSDIIEGFLLDRTAEEAVVQAERDRDRACRQHASLALLLAATCRQTRSYLEPVGSGAACAAGEFLPDERSGDAGAQAGEGPPERRSSVISINSVLDDIYQIAVTEAERSAPVFMPIEFKFFFRSLAGQVLGNMHARGISLCFELSNELPERLNGPMPFLRHALERALLAVTAAAQGGWAGVSLMRDPDAPRSHDMTRVLFSVTWSRFPQEAACAQHHHQAASNGYTTLLLLPADPETPVQVQRENTGALEVAEEQEVVRYLAQKMHGEFLEGVFTPDLHSLRMVVPLHRIAEEEQPAVPATPAPQQPAREDAVLSAAAQAPENAPADKEPFVFVPSAASDSLSLPDASSLELLAMNEEENGPVYHEAEDGAAPGAGLEILLVDDNLNNHLLFSLFLRDTMHHVTEAHDGQQGVEAFQHGSFDLIFMNMELPLRGGYQATRIIRALEADSGKTPTPIVGMTTYVLPEFRRQCIIAGCSAFLSKPFTKNALLSMLDAFARIREEEKKEEGAFVARGDAAGR